MGHRLNISGIKPATALTMKNNLTNNLKIKWNDFSITNCHKICINFSVE